MKQSCRFLARWPLLSAGGLTFVTLGAGAVCVIMADFGRPIWLFAPLYLWLATVGLPATLAVLLVASFWGRTPWLTGLPEFAISASLVAFAAEAATIKLLIRGLRETP